MLYFPKNIIFLLKLPNMRQAYIYFSFIFYLLRKYHRELYLFIDCMEFTANILRYNLTTGYH